MVSCFQSHGPLGISEDVFMGWLMREPQLLVWLSTLYRLKAAEKGMVVKAFFRLKSKELQYFSAF